MSVTWSNQLIDMLIDLYKTQPILWDSRDENYKNKNLKKDAWKIISDAMGLHELELQRKIKNLTAQFFREKKKIKEDNKSGVAASDTPKWFAYQRLLFLSDRNEPRLSVKKGINETNDIGVERSTEGEISQNQASSSNEVNTNDITVQPPPDSQPTGPPQPGCSTNSDTRKYLKGSKRKISNYDQRREEAYDELQEFQAKKFRNRFSIFGELVATKLEALKTSYAQNVVEHLISNILFEASLGKYDYPAARQMTPFSTHSSNTNFSIHSHIASPEYASSPSPQSHLPAFASQVQHTQNTVPKTEQPLTLQYASSPSPQP